MYKVIEFFTDLHDNDHPYEVGDPFPREGVEVTDERIKELCGSDNKRHMPLIEEVVEESDEEKPKKGKKKSE